MLKTDILNAPLLSALATLGHTDTVVIADCGLPIPAGPSIVDLALVRGTPSFEDILEVLARNLVIESSTLASEAAGTGVELACRGLPHPRAAQGSPAACQGCGAHRRNHPVRQRDPALRGRFLVL